jgi:hypothetical protein
MIINSNISITVFHGIRDLLFHPDAFFARVSQEKINLIPPLLIVGTGILFTLLPFVIALVYYSLTVSINLHNIGWEGMIKNYLLCYGVIPLVTWGVLSLGAYGFSHLLDGKGSLTATVQNMGYGMMPWAVSVIGMTSFGGILFFIAYILPSTIIPMEEYAPYGYGIFPYISLIILFWMWYLWILAIRHTHQFTMRKAAMITVVPVAIYVSVTIPVVYYLEGILRILTGA